MKLSLGLRGFYLGYRIVAEGCFGTETCGCVLCSKQYVTASSSSSPMSSEPEQAFYDIRVMLFHCNGCLATLLV